MLSNIFKRGRAVKTKRDFTTMVRDAEGEKKIHATGKKLRSAKKLFVDPDFPTDARMLFYDPKRPSKSLEKVPIEDIQWKRPSEMGDVTEKPQVFADGIEPEDINQGSVGDCYLLAAIAICSTRAELIEDLIVEDEADVGLFGVKFNYQGEWHTVVVDDLLPCTQTDKGWMPIFAKWKGPKETWAMIAEKAWAKLHGCYEAIDGGRTEDTLGYLSGGASINYRFENSVVKGQIESGVFFDKLLASHKMNSEQAGVFISTSGVAEAAGGKKGDHDASSLGDGGEEGGLVSGHAYSVLDVRKLSNGVRVVQLRNPWGSYEWQGDWSDSSPLWTTELKKEVDFVDANDGSFWMGFEDWTSHFAEVGVCKTIPSSWNSVYVHGACKAPNLGSNRLEALAPYNPSFVLTNASPALWLGMEQRDVRGSDSSWMPYILYILKMPKGDEVVSFQNAVRPAMLLGLERTRTIEIDDLDPAEGPYLVVVAGFHQGVAGEFGIKVYSEGAVSLEPHGTPKPTAEHAALMKPLKLTTDCATCSTATDRRTRKSFKQAHFHPSAECYRCTVCKAPFIQDEVDSHLKISDVGLEGGVLRGYCFPCFNEAHGERCIHCDKPVKAAEDANEQYFSFPGQGKVHSACGEGYRASIADKCSHCKEPVAKIEGKFSGRSSSGKGPDGVEFKVHAECCDAFLASKAPKCIHCNEPVARMEGKFSGQSYTLDDGAKCHEECYEAYEATNAAPCVQCKQPCTGEYYEVPGGVLHGECMEAFQLASAPKCIQCSQAVAQHANFTGKHYTLPEGKLHIECKEAFDSK